MHIDISDQNFKQFEQHAREGVFLKKRITVWRGRPTHDVNRLDKGSKVTITSYSRPTPYDCEVKSVLADINWFFRLNTYPCGYGVFVPISNWLTFRSGIEDRRKRFLEFAEKTEQNYDQIYADTWDRHVNIAHWIWKEEYGNEGDPPETFVDGYCRRLIEKKFSIDKLKRSFIFDIKYLNPFVDETLPKFKDCQNIKESNIMVIKDLYAKTIKKRTALALYLVKKKKKILETTAYSPIRAMLRHVGRWRSLIYYDDPRLLEEINNLRSVLMRTMMRSRQEAADMMEDGLIEYLFSNVQYPINFTYDRKA